MFCRLPQLFDDLAGKHLTKQFSLHKYYFLAYLKCKATESKIRIEKAFETVENSAIIKFVDLF